MDSLKLHKLQNIRQELNLDIVRQDVADLKTFTEKQIDERLPLGTAKEIVQKLRKESEMEKKVTSLETRVKNIEESMVVLFQNQQNQTALLRQLVQAQTPTPLLDDNKKGEKGEKDGEGGSLKVQITQVLVSTITASPTLQIKEKLDGIDLIYLAAVR